MREQVLRYIGRRRLITAGDRVVVAVSGGADSVALLRLLLEVRSELGILLAVAHFNHRLRGENSDADEAFVMDLAQHHELQAFAGRASVTDSAQVPGIESAARKLRYEWLTRIAIENRFDEVATAHTLDDQAETVLLKFLRGAGSKGLAGIYPQLLRGPEKNVRFVRPLLKTTRGEIEAYLVSLNQPWREDESNLDHRFLRNRVRHALLPLLESDYNPNIRQLLSEVAEINEAEEAFWQEATADSMRLLRTQPHELRLTGFAGHRTALQRRMLKCFLEENNIACDFRHIEAARDCALGRLSQLDLGDGWMVQRKADALVLEDIQCQPTFAGYSYRLRVPGEVRVPEIGCVLRAVPLSPNSADQAQPGTLLKADLVRTELLVRNRHPGDRFHVAYTGRAHKLKDLFWERKIAPAERALWPVLLKGTHIVWVRDIGVSDAYCWRPGDGNAVRIDCVALDQSL